MRNWSNQSNPSVPILMYHQISARPVPSLRKYTVSPQMFRAQMLWLALRGYNSITFDTLLDHRAGRSSLPARPIAITFDDGFRDCVAHAVPILQHYGFTAMFFLVPGLIDTTCRWLPAEGGADIPLIDWPAARRLERLGFHCGAHSMSHPHLDEVPLDVCEDELLASRHLLESQLDHDIVHMAYPYGAYNQEVRAAVVRAGYRSACSVRIGVSTAHDDQFALHRIPVDGDDSLIDFICRLHTARTSRELVSDVTTRVRQYVGHRTLRA